MENKYSAEKIKKNINNLKKNPLDKRAGISL